jgi:hypothetical protein
VDCSLVHNGELWPTFQKAHQTVSEDIYVTLLQSYVSTTPISSAFYVSAITTTSRNRRWSSTEPIQIGFEAFKLDVGVLHFGPLR